MDFATKEDFEKYLYDVIKNADGISAAAMANPGCKDGLKLSQKEKVAVGKLYKTSEKDLRFGNLVVSILEKDARYECVEKPNPQKTSWIFKIADTTEESAETSSVEANLAQNSNRTEESEENSAEESVSDAEQSQENPESEISAKKSDAYEEESDELPNFKQPEKNSSLKTKLKKLIRENMVKIGDDFFISKFLVTQNLYEKVMKENPSKFQDNSKNALWRGLPVETVSFNDALSFCEKLSELCGYEQENGFRLPTEKEWTFVANGGAENPKNKYAGSDNQNAVAWYKINSKEKTHGVGELSGVKVGDGEIFDLSGNVWEWCQSSESKKAVCYGGSYEDSEVFLGLGKSQNKQILEKNVRKSAIGFRIAVNFVK